MSPMAAGAVAKVRGVVLLLALMAATTEGWESMWPQGEMRRLEEAYFGQGMGIFMRMEQNSDQEWVEITYEDMRPPAAACRVGQLRWPGGNNANCWNTTTNDYVLSGTRGRTCQEYKGGQQTWEAHANSSLYSASSLEAAFEGILHVPMVWDINVLSSSGEGGYQGGREASAYLVESMAEEQGVEVSFIELGNEFYRQAYALDFPDVSSYAQKVQAVMDAAEEYYSDADVAVPVSYSQLLSSFEDPAAPVYGTSTPAYYGIHAGLALGLLALVTLAVYCWSLLQRPLGAVALLLLAFPVAVFSGVLIIVVVHAPSQPASNSWPTTVTHRVFGYLTYAAIGGFSLASVLVAIVSLLMKKRLDKMIDYAAIGLAGVFMAISIIVVFPALLSGFLLIETDWEWYVAAVISLLLAAALASAPTALRWGVHHQNVELLPPSAFNKVISPRKKPDSYEIVESPVIQEGETETASASEEPGNYRTASILFFALVAVSLLAAVAFLTGGVFVSHAAPRPWNDQIQAQLAAQERPWRHFTVHDYGLNTNVLDTFGNSSADWPSVVAAYPQAALEIYGEMVRLLYGNDSKIWMTEAGILLDQYGSPNCTDASTSASCFMTQAVNSDVLQGISVIGRILTAINDEYETYETINTFKLQQVFGLSSSQDLGGNELFRFPTADDPGPYCTTYTQVWAHVAHVALDLSNFMQAIRVSGEGDSPPRMLPVQVLGRSLPCLQASFFYSMEGGVNSTCSTFSVVAINRCEDTMLTRIQLPDCFAALVDPTDPYGTYAFQQTSYVYYGPWGPPEWVPCPDASEPFPWTQPYLPQIMTLNITNINDAPEVAVEPLSLAVMTWET